MVLSQEKFFNRRNWILENISKLNLTPQEALLLLSIDFINEFNENVTVDILTNRTNMSKKEVENTIKSLCDKGYLQITTKRLKIVFDISAVFALNQIDKSGNNVFSLFEQEFNRVLTQKELTQINEWLSIYDSETVIDALRTAAINNALNFKYIEKVLVNKDEK